MLALSAAEAEGKTVPGGEIEGRSIGLLAVRSFGCAELDLVELEAGGDGWRVAVSRVAVSTDKVFGKEPMGALVDRWLPAAFPVVLLALTPALRAVPWETGAALEISFCIGRGDFDEAEDCDAAGVCGGVAICGGAGVWVVGGVRDAVDLAMICVGVTGGLVSSGRLDEALKFGLADFGFSDCGLAMCDFVERELCGETKPPWVELSPLADSAASSCCSATCSCATASCTTWGSELADAGGAAVESNGV